MVKTKHARQTMTYRLKNGWAEKQCLICNRTFFGTKYRIYCKNKECKRKAGSIRHQKSKRNKDCESCGVSFITRWARYCPKCKPKFSGVISQVEFKTCLDCGKEFQLRRPRQNCCSKECSDGRWNRRKRGERKNQFVEDVEMSVLFARDGGICQLCAEPISLEYKGRHPLAPTIDHITPTSKGGEHSYANTQLAHFKCNSKKGAKV